MNNKKIKSKSIIFIILLLILLWAYPFEYKFIGDDLNVISERVFFENNYDWLKHILLFNQTRITYVGDYMLIRPVLFFYTWFLDVFYRSERIIHYLLSILFSLSACLIIANEQKNKNIFIGVLAAIIFITFSAEGGIVFYWSHLNPYIISLITFYFGIKNANNENKKIRIMSLLILEIAIFCHEHAFVAILLIYLYYIFIQENVIYNYN